MCVGMSKCAVQKLPNECAIKQYVVAGGSVRGWLPRPSLDHFRPTMDVQASSLPVGLGPSGACYVVLRALRVTGANEERWSILLVSWNRPNITPKRSQHEASTDQSTCESSPRTSPVCGARGCVASLPRQVRQQASRTEGGRVCPCLSYVNDHRSCPNPNCLKKPNKVFSIPK